MRRVLLENFELNSDSMAKDMQVLMRKDVQQLSCFDSCWGWSALAESTVVRVSQNLPKLSLQTGVSRHGVDSHERIGESHFELD